jgi:hypothetical protein
VFANKKTTTFFQSHFLYSIKIILLLLATTEKEKKLVHVNKFVPSKKISFLNTSTVFVLLGERRIIVTLSLSHCHFGGG